MSAPPLGNRDQRTSLNRMRGAMHLIGTTSQVPVISLGHPMEQAGEAGGPALKKLTNGTFPIPPSRALAAITHPAKRSSEAVWFLRRWAVMGPISRSILRALDKPPRWANLILGILAVVWCLFYIARYGFLSFLLHMILSPLP